MNLSVEPGKYVIAVSGGVDSTVLLALLQRLPDVELVVAHYDHGIRESSDADRIFVGQQAKMYALPYIYEHGHLGAQASEATARTARYAFLRRVQKQVGARAIITAHHQDDLIETAIINILRGTGRKGLSALATRSDVVRPLLGVSKKDILAYATAHHIIWHEDSTNASDQYLRNYVRIHLMPRLGELGRKLLLTYIEKAAVANPVIDDLLLRDIMAQGGEVGLNRRWFIMQPHDVSKEIMAAWLRRHGIHDFDAKTIDRLVIAAKVDVPGNVRDVNAGYFLNVGKTHLRLQQGSTS